MKIRTLILKMMLVLASVVIGLFAAMLFWRLPVNLIRIYHQAATAWLMTVGVYVAVGCFYLAVLGAWQLLRRIETDTAFSPRAVGDLRRLKWAVAGIAGGLLGIMPQVYVVAQHTDAPGVCLIGGGIVALPLMVTIFLGVLEQLWATALVYKRENELTV